MVPRLLSIATALPPHVIDRAEAAHLGRTLFGIDLDRLGPIYANAGIERRHSCVPLDWYLAPRGWAERARLFAAHGTELAARATLDALDRADLPPAAIDAVVAVSTTGIATPSLDALLMERLGLRRNLLRLPVFGLGCAGGVLGLARAAALARAMPGATILLVVVELCGLTFRPGDRSPANIVATALFGDGCAAALLSSDGHGPAITAWGEHTWPDSLDVMGWRVEEDGLGVVFSRDIPSLVAREFRPVLDRWLRGQGLERPRIAHWACHPGGAKVVNALEEAIGLPAGALQAERQVLRDHGNMSAATVLFVLQRHVAARPAGRLVATALGPGFSAGFLMLEGPE